MIVDTDWYSRLLMFVNRFFGPSSIKQWCNCFDNNEQSKL